MSIGLFASLDLKHLRSTTMKKLQGYLWGITSSTTFGLIPLFSLPLIMIGMSTATILMYRFACASLLVGIFMAIKRISFSISTREIFAVSLLAFLYFLSAFLLFYAYRLMPSGIATVAHFTYPIFVSLIMFLFFGQKLNKTTLVAIGIALLGVGFLSGASLRGNVSWWSFVIVILSGLAYALYIVGVQRSKLARLHYFTLTFYVMLFASFCFALLALFNLAPNEIGLITKGWGYVVLLAFVPTLMSNIALIQSIKHLGSVHTAILGAMEPLTAVLIGCWVFHENLTIGQALGIGLVLIAVWLTIKGQKRG